MESSQLTESMLADIAEQAISIAQLVNIIKWLKFDNCYGKEQAIDDLWEIAYITLLNFKNISKL